MLEVAHAANGQGHQQLEASVDGGRGAAHRDSLLRGELPALHVLEVDVGRREDEVVDELLIREKRQREVLSHSGNKVNLYYYFRL